MNPKNIRKVNKGGNPHKQFAGAAKGATPKSTPSGHEAATKYQGPNLKFGFGKYTKGPL